MSKKKKFKKFSKNMILEELNNEKSDTKEKIKEEKSAKDITPVKNNIEEINYVRKDLKKVAFVFSTIICLLVIITIIQARTTWLDNIMDGVIKTLNIN